MEVDSIAVKDKLNELESVMGRAMKVFLSSVEEGYLGYQADSFLHDCHLYEELLGKKDYAAAATQLGVVLSNHSLSDYTRKELVREFLASL